VEDARKQTTTQAAAAKEELPEADEFGLPIRPSRRRVYEEEEDGEESVTDRAGKAVVKEREIPSDIPAAVKEDTAGKPEMRTDPVPKEADANADTSAHATTTKSDVGPPNGTIQSDPTIHSRLKTELDQATASGTLSPFPQYNETQALPYFQACLKEAMRLRPAVGLNITRLVPPQGAEIAGKRFPGGTRVAVNAWVLHRDEGVFGAAPKVFRPERWLGLGGDEVRRMERFMFQFGGGSHLCELLFILKGVSICYLLSLGSIFPIPTSTSRWQSIEPKTKPLC
jgi:hypothetical protein